MYEYEEVRIKMDLIQKNLLEQVAGLHEIPEGAYNIRANGTKLGRNTTANIDIVTKTDKDGDGIIDDAVNDVTEGIDDAVDDMTDNGATDKGTVR